MKKLLLSLSLTCLLLILLLLLGFRFENPIYNRVSFILIMIFSWPIPYFIFSYHIKNIYLNIVKMSLGIIISLLVLGTIIPILFTSFDLYMLISEWNGIDKSKTEIERLNMKNFDVVSYQTNGGATVDFGVSIYKEKKIGFGIKKTKYIDGIYHAIDIDIEKTSDNNIEIKKIEFTNPQREIEYYDEGGNLKNGYVINI